MDFGGVLTILAFVVLGFMGFVIYFIFKQLQFVIQAINLYKKMINRQDVMIKLLKDIRGGDGKDYEDDEMSSKEESSLKGEDDTSVSASIVGIGASIEPYGQKAIKITKFTKISPAREAGLRVNDVIVEIDDVLVDNQLGVAQKLREGEGTKVKIKVLRNKEVKEFEVVRQRIE